MEDETPGGKKGFRIKRVYAPAEAGDGYRVLVDRLWPRGVAKDRARVDLWLKDIAPSDALRRRVHSGAIAWDDFVASYTRELEQEPARTAAANLCDEARRRPVTLLYAARDETRNHAVALKSWLDARR